MDGDLLAQFALAARLNKTMGEILEMNSAEFLGWQLFFDLQDRKSGKK